MSEEFVINKKASDEEIYESLLPQLGSLISGDDPLLSKFANLTAALKESFTKICWVGFYFLNGNKLYLGPFQGKVACTTIELGKGVCGTTAKRGETIIVQDVEKFPGHIACDSGSKSEIVIPIFRDGNVFGVLDIDSYEYSAFDEIDKIYLEKLSTLINSNLSLSGSLF